MKPRSSRPADPMRLVTVAPTEGLFALATAWWAAESSGNALEGQRAELEADHSTSPRRAPGPLGVPPTEVGR